MPKQTSAPAGRLSKWIALSFVLSSSFVGIAHANTAPTISGTPPKTLNVGSYYNFRPTASDRESAASSLRFSIANKPSWATFSIYSGQLHGVPTQAGTWSNIKISVTDGKATTALPAFSIKAVSTAPTNRAPVISGAPAGSVGVGSAYSFLPSASDPDGDKLSFSIQNRPGWATFSASTGQLSGTPGAAHVGTFSNIVISVSDGKATAKLPAFSITVSQSNGAPTISGTPPTSVSVNSYYNFRPTASDPDSDTLRFSVANQPSWASFSIYSGQLHGVPTQAGTWSNIRISVTDGKSTTTLPAFSITAGSATATANRAPAISGSPSTSVDVGSAYSFRPTASDPDGDTLGFSIQNRPAWATFNTATGQLSGAPGASHVGTFSNIVISVSDGKVTTKLPAFAITVSKAAATASPGTAVLNWTPPTMRANNTTLSNLAGYRIAYGTSATVLHESIELTNPGLSSYVVQGLKPGTYYFVVRAYDSTGSESDLSNVISVSVK